MAQKKTFELSMARLEEIVSSMEKSDIDLEEAIKLFKEGQTLIKNCEKMLNEAESSVKIIKADDAGMPVEEKFNDGL